eukprot:CAMPEP_0180134656 /NCGR_PEP_ID=MMETSP0986-20121125/10299_1 /TAXON_ID=697907 /ORGANISM="non described non described, Strain CCMP2293" /LENGTH=208 /DNA_ID=CAMNT_0022075073 /DNA_START=132 /DNA_END=759 /DNA_ORIENTATION=-
MVSEERASAVLPEAQGDSAAGGARSLGARRASTPSRRSVDAHADPKRLVGHVEHALLDLAVDLFRGVDKRLLHVVCGLGRGFQKDEPVLPCERFALSVGDGAAVLEVALVPDEHDGHVGVGVLQRVLKPRRQVVERLSPRDVVHQQRASSSPVVRPCNRAERLLPRRIPDLQLDWLGIDGHPPRPELHSYCQIVHRLEALVRELQQQA